MNIFIEIKFTGGLGNQMFQYATIRSLSIQNNTPFLLLNIESYKNEPHGRKFRLNNFNIIGTIIKNDIVNNILRKDTKINNLLIKIPFYKRIEEATIKVELQNVKLKFLTSTQGYWQSDEYFKSIRSILLKEFIPKNIPPFPQWVIHKNTIAIHVRRNDYITENGFGVLSENYYLKAIEFIKEKINEPMFIVFSDDLVWCKNKFNYNKFIFFEDENWSNDYLQLYLISKCNHQIIANSSFSWWGAWLNTYQNKIVIRPQQPFIDESLMNKFYYPKEWISINN